MASQKLGSFTMSTIFLWLSFISIGKDMGKLGISMAEANANTPLFPAMFVFGDSLLDPGNRVQLTSSSPLPLFLSNPDRPPYGRDLPPHVPPGRYSNGLVLSDILANLMGLPYPPPYLSQRDNIINGTSFAFGGAVILDLGRAILQTQRFDFDGQVSSFKDVQQQLSANVGEGYASELISKSLFLICIGANDYLANYYSNPIRKSFAQKRYTPSEFTETLISLYRQNILTLYNMGARKFAVVSLPPIGCTPTARFLFSWTNNHNATCIDFINNEVENFNVLLLDMSIQLQDAHPDAHFTYLNAYDHTYKVIQNPMAYGFVDSLKPCCAIGPYGGVPVCSTNINSICSDASKYIFWDFVHPTERAQSLAVEWFLQGSPPDIQLFSLQQLSAL